MSGAELNFGYSTKKHIDFYQAQESSSTPLVFHTCAGDFSESADPLMHTSLQFLLSQPGPLSPLPDDCNSLRIIDLFTITITLLLMLLNKHLQQCKTFIMFPSTSVSRDAQPWSRRSATLESYHPTLSAKRFELGRRSFPIPLEYKYESGRPTLFFLIWGDHPYLISNHTDKCNSP